MRKFLPYATLLIVCVLLTVFEADMLYMAQEQNLFLHSPLFFQQQMVKAGGLLTWAGCYLTQFFYYPLLGVGMLALLWAIIMVLLRRVFGMKDLWLTLVPVACLLLTITTLGYWVYYLKLPGALFDATVGTIIAVMLVWGYQSLPAKYFLRSAFIPLVACIGYPLFGFYGLWAVAMMGITAWRIKGSQRILDSLLALVFIAAIPLVCYHTIYHETNIVNIYWAALPVFSYQGTRFMGYYVPYIVLVASICLMSLHLSTPKRVRWVILPLCAIGVAVFWYKDDNFHRELAMSRSIGQQDWEQVLKTAKGVKGEPTRAMCMMQNLALFRLGKRNDEMFMYPNGAARPNAPFPVRTVHTYGKMLYLQYGVLNYCYRWCMEDGVEYGWTVERLRLMAQCSLLNGEYVAAQRFLNLLKKTDFHKGWAKEHEALLYRPALFAQNPELGPILPLLRSDNFLTADQSQEELFLIEQILSSPGATREQQELARFTMRYYRHNRYKLVEQ